MAQVYSKLLGAMSAVTVLDTTLHTVPAGTVTVLRDLDLFSSGVGAAATVRSSRADLIICRWLATSNPQSFAWRGSQVFEVGETIRIVIESGTWWARASGYSLGA